MTKIIVNGKFLSQRVTGVQRYAREILTELDKLCYGIEIEMAIPADVMDLPVYQNIKIKKVGKFKGNLWEQLSFPKYVRKQKGVSLNLCNSAPLIGKKIVTIHDMKIKAHPEFFSKKFLLWYNFLFKNITKKSLAIITVSNFSKDEIIKYYNVNFEKITVVYNAWQHFNSINYDEKILLKYGLSKYGYYFSMSSLEPNKNLSWIIETAKKNPTCNFVIAGGLNKKVFAEKNILLPKNVMLVGYISDSEAKTLMRDCKAFLFPTLYEGFGIPPLEAMAAGCKSVIVSDSNVMHELFEDSVVYIDPYDYSVNLERLINEKELNKLNIEDILNKFSWSTSAVKLLNKLK